MFEDVREIGLADEVSLYRLMRKRLLIDMLDLEHQLLLQRLQLVALLLFVRQQFVEDRKGLGHLGEGVGVGYVKLPFASSPALLTVLVILTLNSGRLLVKFIFFNLLLSHGQLLLTVHLMLLLL